MRSDRRRSAAAPTAGPCSVIRSPLSVAEDRVSPGKGPWSRLRRLRMGTQRHLRPPDAAAAPAGCRMGGSLRPVRRGDLARRFAGGRGRRHRPDRARLPTPPRRRSAPGVRRGGGSLTLPGNCQEVQIVATDAPRSNGARPVEGRRRPPPTPRPARAPASEPKPSRRSKSLPRTRRPSSRTRTPRASRAGGSRPGTRSSHGMAYRWTVAYLADAGAPCSCCWEPSSALHGLSLNPPPPTPAAAMDQDRGQVVAAA